MKTNVQKIDFSKLTPVNEVICENCDGVIIDGKCKQYNQDKRFGTCPSRVKDREHNWFYL